MSGPTPVTATSEPGSEGSSWRVRAAEPKDSDAIATAVAELLSELGATPPPAQAMQRTARTLIEDPKAGALFVAEADGMLVGVLSASLQSAIHIPGRYALIQDLWVHSAWRSRAIGRALLAALIDHVRELDLARIEVGLPKEDFGGLPATTAFYRANGFTPLGPRMRWIA